MNVRRNAIILATIAAFVITWLSVYAVMAMVAAGP